jgi:AcrR family transcriptional regulator
MEETPRRSRVPSQPRAVRTRAGLVNAAAREFSAKGYAATTAKTIADRAQTATGSFYQYFTSKDEVLRELASTRQRDLIEQALARLEPSTLSRDSRQRLRNVVALVMDYHASDPGLHAVVTERRYADPELDALLSGGERQLLERVAELLGRWGFAGDRLATAFVLLGTIEGAVHAHTLGHAAVDDARFVSALVEAVARIAGPESPKEKTHGTRQAQS